MLAALFMKFLLCHLVVMTTENK